MIFFYFTEMINCCCWAVASSCTTCKLKFYFLNFSLTDLL